MQGDAEHADVRGDITAGRRHIAPAGDHGTGKGDQLRVTLRDVLADECRRPLDGRRVEKGEILALAHDDRERLGVCRDVLFADAADAGGHGMLRQATL